MLIDHVIKPFGVLLLSGNLLAQPWKILSFALYAESLTRIAVFKNSDPKRHGGHSCVAEGPDSS
jgi:hypothetical protein